MSHPEDDELHQKLNKETGKLCWEELQPHFARGVVIKVDLELDLIKVASALAMDEKETFESWLDCGLVARSTDEDAIRWDSTQPTFWAIVTAPWVLVQEITIQ